MVPYNIIKKYIFGIYSFPNPNPKLLKDLTFPKWCIFFKLVSWLVDKDLWIASRLELIARIANMLLEVWNFQPHSLVRGEWGGAGG